MAPCFQFGYSLSTANGRLQPLVQKLFYEEKRIITNILILKVFEEIYQSPRDFIDDGEMLQQLSILKSYIYTLNLFEFIIKKVDNNYILEHNTEKILENLKHMLLEYNIMRAHAFDKLKNAIISSISQIITQINSSSRFYSDIQSLTKAIDRYTFLKPIFVENMGETCKAPNNLAKFLFGEISFEKLLEVANIEIA